MLSELLALGFMVRWFQVGRGQNVLRDGGMIRRVADAVEAIC